MNSDIRKMIYVSIILVITVVISALGNVLAIILLQSNNSLNIETYTTTPNISNISKKTIERNIFLLKLTILGWYYNNTNGCYIVVGSTEYRLDDCSNNYYNNDLKSSMNCSCGTLSKTLEIPNCDSGDECLKPYCLGKCKDSKDKTCSANNNITLYKCNDKSIDDKDHVYYYYKSNPLISIIPQSFIVQKMLKEEYTPNSKKSKIVLYILIFLGTIFLIFIILFVYNYMKKKKFKR